MLSKPNVNDLMEKSGSRYEAALAIAKRAREIERKRGEFGDDSVKDSVDLASKQIMSEQILVKINGEYVCPPEVVEETEEAEEIIEEVVEEVIEEVEEKPKKRRAKK